MGRWPWQRDTHAQIINQLSSSKVIGYDVGFYEYSYNNNSDQTFINAVQNQRNLILAAEISDTQILKPIAGEYGIVNVITDSDGIIRSIRTDLGETFSQKITQTAGVETNLPATYNINFANNIHPTYSASKVLKENLTFPGKIVLVGATAPSLQDLHNTPTIKDLPGVYIHASAIQTQLTNSSPKENFWLNILFIAAYILAISYISNKGIQNAARFALLLSVIHICIAIFAFKIQLIINILYPILAIAVTYTATVISHYIIEKNQRKKTLGAFEKYVSPHVIDELLKNPNKLKLGGEKREITILFSDIRGFTSLSEKMDPQELVEFLNVFLTKMTDIILKHDGVVDKFMGDAIMAFWNAPLTQENHPELAVKAAKEMMDALEEMKKDMEIDIGIGINTGSAVVGNMGSTKRFDYTAMGDTVNLGSRLEGLSKQYHMNVILSEDTVKRITEPTIELDKVRVKGKKKPTTIYTLGTDEAFSKALKLYYQAKFTKALSEFKNSKIKAKKTFIERCQTLIKEKPEEWDGVWNLQSK